MIWWKEWLDIKDTSRYESILNWNSSAYYESVDTNIWVAGTSGQLLIRDS